MLSCALSQVGQCGNQLGSELWGLFAAQSRGPSSSLGHHSGSFSSTDSYSWVQGEDGEFFRLSSTGRRTARCLLIDTEPKVVS
jgi:hypothetical protein